MATRRKPPPDKPATPAEPATLENGSNGQRELYEALVAYREATDVMTEANERHREARARLVAALDALGLPGYVP